MLTGAVVLTGGILAGWHYMQPQLVTYSREWHGDEIQDRGRPVHGIRARWNMEGDVR